MPLKHKLSRKKLLILDPILVAPSVHQMLRSKLRSPPDSFLFLTLHSQPFSHPADSTARIYSEVEHFSALSPTSPLPIAPSSFSSSDHPLTPEYCSSPSLAPSFCPCPSGLATHSKMCIHHFVSASNRKLSYRYSGKNTKYPIDTLVKIQNDPDTRFLTVVLFVRAKDWTQVDIQGKTIACAHDRAVPRCKKESGEFLYSAMRRSSGYIKWKKGKVQNSV